MLQDKKPSFFSAEDRLDINSQKQLFPPPSITSHLILGTYWEKQQIYISIPRLAYVAGWNEKQGMEHL